MTTKSSSMSDKNNDDLKVLYINTDSHHTKSSPKSLGLIFCFLACPKRPSHQSVLAIFYSSLLMPAQPSSALSHFAVMLWYHSEDIKICKFRCLKEGNGFAFHFYGYPKWLPYPGKLLLGARSGSGQLQMLSSFPFLSQNTQLESTGWPVTLANERGISDWVYRDEEV